MRDFMEKNQSRDVVKVLVGNKADLDSERRVSYEEGEKAKKNNGFDIFMEVSAKTGYNINELFINIGKCVMKKQKSFK